MGKILDSINAQLRAGATTSTGVRVGSITVQGSSFIGRAIGGVGRVLTSDATRAVAGTAITAAATGGVMPGRTELLSGLVGSRGGSSGRSATPIVPSRGSGVVPGIIDLGVQILRDRLGGGGGGGSTLQTTCPSGQRKVGNLCVDIMPGGDTQGGGVFVTTGEVVKGRYGAAEQPAISNIRTARCRRGLVLGDDGLCYRRGHLRKDERKWNPGRKPLFTGGEQNAVATAARVAGKLQAHQSRLQRLGMLKKPKGRRQIELELRYGGKLRGR